MEILGFDTSGIRERVAYIIPFGQMFTIAIVGLTGIHSLHEKFFALPPPPAEPPVAESPVTVTGISSMKEVNGWLKMTIPMIKNRCVIQPIGTVQITQGEGQGRTFFATVAPTIKLRPSERVQHKLIQFEIPDNYDQMASSSVLMDIPYQCADGAEVVYLDPIEVPPLPLLSEQKH